MQESTNAQIRYVHGNRLERLAERLAADLASAPIADPLVSELIVVPHPGMGRWLQRELARHWGIAMRLELPLPGRLVWDLATELTGIDEADASFEAGPLAFRILALLQGWAHVGWRGAPRSLPRPQDSLARWALAEHLGALFDQYQVYRPDWIRAWDEGTVPRGMPQQGAWQGELWRALRRGSGAPHRAEVLDRAMEILSLPSQAMRSSLPARVSVFGVGTLPEPYLLFFAQLAHRTQVNWYHPDPGAAYWGDIVSERERARALARLQRLGGRHADTHHDVAHPLLASLGAIGRDFVRALHGQGIATIADEDEFDLPASDTLLGWLQAGIVLLDPGHEAPPALAKGAQGAAGFSGTRNLRVHSCPNRLREVEVLHDVLLGLFDELEGLRPDDIVVMSPRPADYAPLVRAVFDAAPPQRRVPYTISDRPVAAMHPLPALFLELLNLPDERFTASRVLGWLATPAISRRLGLDADALEWLSALVGEAGIRWGLDGASRAAAGSTASPLYSWRFGLDRLLLGYACGATGQLVEGVAPYPGIEGNAALAVGALSTFVERLATWSERLRSPRTASGWRTTLTAMLEVMFEREQADEGEAQGYAAITAALEGWEDDAVAGKADALELEPDVMRAALAARFERPSPSQVFPGHGVTVCAMVPMRNLPFRVVCLLGLDSGEFPRVPAATGLDLMTQSPRPGDRSLAADDRYLFLEALMSAREHLHLSYVGREGRDLAKRPPGAALAELIDFIAAAYPDLESDAAFDALVFEHRLHPYARDYFLPDAAFHSHAGEWIAPWIPPPEPTRADEGEARLEFDLVELARYARDPQRYFAERVLRLALPGDSVIEDEEPIEVSALDAYHLREHALAVYARGMVPVAGEMLPGVRAGAFLPIGVAGETAWAEAVALAGSIELTRTSQIDTGHELPDLEIDVRIGEFRLSGHITDLTTVGLIRTRAGQLRGGDWLRLALEARLAHVHGGAPAQAWGIDVVERKVRISRLDLSALDEAWALAVLQALQAAQSARPPLLRHASWAYAKAYRKGREAALREAEAAFRGNEHAPGDFKDEATRLLWGDALVMDVAFEQAAIGLLVPVANAITVEP